ncbi:purine-nucleoside phosphorylase [Halalkalibacterium halodurans]|uniref:Purine nucleoside phosphorylase n=2 Tax=Halalkalibacterium halodurans TaxID=86665 RepID=Q9KCN7_HALH5|nr:purine-nucleoside phosphorylase [Halalkalibacterium halodurans]MDY7222053.1 purine-nucleoside phosphorylase [Halalkalibacterium halodurans]MDY7241329.1 purine-nucleoside phosphorylase [Halalkalibacterium halodurans]MED3648504.1 purine-nucleoside phosphorylase [Halalkalibacterium halodurans]MED4083082.1 purine-nucleoside phosphorylase [Halalkalibacterium halodurans]MED4087089.1 purine-nucleoside phosphorylase [Halalkalibacterium halodurans]
MENIREKVKQSAEYLLGKIKNKPAIGLILGSGLGELANEIEEAVHIPYEQIPNFPVSTVEGHAGQLVIGTLHGKNVVAMQGRFHYYEGYTMQEVTFPVRVMKEIGVELIVVTNACGGMNKNFAPGDLMIITDHLNMTGDNPLIGPNVEEWGPRFPDMSHAYTPELVEFVEETANRLDIKVQKGVYAGITGPTYMTGAELIMLRNLGGDVIGMSTVPEVIVARHAGMKVIGISCITDMAIGEEIAGITHEEVVAVANKTKPKFIKLVKEIVANVNV